MKRIYADAAATTRISQAALNEMNRIAYDFPGNPSSAHTEGRAAKKKLEEYRERCAKMLDCEPTEIIFTSGATEGNQTIKKIPRIWWNTSEIEHPSMRGLPSLQIPVESNGFVDLDWLYQKKFDYPYGRNQGISVMWANNEIGTIQQIEIIGKICDSKHNPFHTDATAAVGHIPVSFRKSNAWYFTCSAHKFHGPRGVGILIVKKLIADPSYWPLMRGGMQERGHRAGTENLPAIAGMTVALEEAVCHMDENFHNTSYLRDRLIDGLLEIKGTVLNGNPILRLPGNVNVCFDGIEGESLLTLLDAKGIAASAGSACHTGQSEPSHVLLAIGRSREQANAALRLTIDETNTEEEIDEIIKTVRESVEYLRKFTPNKTK